MAKYTAPGRLMTFEFEGAVFHLPRTRAEMERIQGLASEAARAMLELAKSPENEKTLDERVSAIARKSINAMLGDERAAEKIGCGDDWLIEDYVNVMLFILAQVKEARRMRTLEYSPARGEV